MVGEGYFTEDLQWWMLSLPTIVKGVNLFSAVDRGCLIHSCHFQGQILGFIISYIERQWDIRYEL